MGTTTVSQRGAALLAGDPRSGIAPITVTVTVPIHRLLHTFLAVDATIERLEDRTQAFVHTFHIDDEPGRLRMKIHARPSSTCPALHDFAQHHEGT